jgi:cbb3-type cytochrome oxidase maturation protein
MQIFFFMIGVSLVLALGFLGAFFWAMRTGQNDDLHTPGMRILLDDQPAKGPASASTTKKQNFDF